MAPARPAPPARRPPPRRAARSVERASRPQLRARRSGAAGTTGKIGVILPDTKSSARWETQDRPNLEAAFKAAGVEYDIQNANGDKAAMATIADQMIANGATVLAIVNLDSESGAAIEKKAKAQGVQTIDYDRLTLGGAADYYVSFNNTKVGELQGKGLAELPGRRRQEHRLRQRLADGQQRHAVLGRARTRCSTR